MSNDRLFSSGRLVSFKSGDYSGSVSGIPDRKRSKDENQENEEPKKEQPQQEIRQSEFVDRGAQLRATLNSLAIMNVANIIRRDTHSKDSDER